jgi:hypothetical protein
MIGLAKDNYIRAVGHGENFVIEVDTLKKTSLNYFQESCEAAKEIEATTQGNLYLMYSGGVDSEYALNVFLSLGIKITPVIIKLKPNYNDFDTSYAYKFCQEKNIDPITIDIDYNQFVTSGKMLEIAKTIKSEVYHYATTAYAIGQLSGTVICGDGEPYIKKNENSDNWEVTIYEYDYALPNFYKIYNIAGTAHFNRYNPGMMRSFLESQRIRYLAANKISGKLGSHSSKFVIYNQFNDFNIIKRPKFHGYETIDLSKIKEHEDFLELEQIGKQWNGIWSENYHLFMDRVCPL